jgi:hypothetical protein
MYEQQTASGTITARMKRCRFCQEEIIISAQKCKHCGEFLTPAARRAAGVGPVKRSFPTAKVDIPYGPAIFSILCFLPLGIVALIFTIQADSKLKSGDSEGAVASARIGRAVGLAGMLVGLAILFVMLTSQK